MLDRQRLYIVVLYEWRKLVAISDRVIRDLPGTTFHPFFGTSVLELSAPKGKSRELLERTFELLVSHLEPSEDNYRAYVILTGLQLCNGHVRDARRTVRALGKIRSPDLRAIVTTLGKRVQAAAKRIQRQKRVRRSRPE
jgi:hypothetical protein